MSRMPKRVLLGLALILSQAGPVAAAGNLERNVDHFIQDSMERFGVVPGLSICVVKGDKVLYLKGFGYRDVEKQLPVTSDTRFYIASTTKSFTGMAGAVLASEGKIDLDAPVSRYLPGLELPEPLSADKVTLLAMLTHRTGISNVPVQMQLAYKGALSKESFFESLRTKSKPMTTDFAYTNLGYNMFGYVLEAVTGEPWQQVVTETVLQPVGMSHTTTSIEAAMNGEFAYPYIAKGDGYERLDTKTDSTMHAAGGIVTTASDLARWLIANINDGRIDGHQALPAAAVTTAHKRYATTDRDYYRFHRTGYGLGWYYSDFEGDLLMHHFGGFDGYHAHTSFIPKHDIGVAVLINANDYHAGTLAHMVAGYVYESLLDHPDVAAKYERELTERAAEAQATRTFKEDVNVAMGKIMGGDASGTESLVHAFTAARDAGVLDESTVNNLGYALLKRKKLDAAIAVFRFNVETNPDSPNVYDSLGEAFETAGQLERAKENYAKAVDIATTQNNPNIELFKKNLDRVSGMLN